MKIIPPIILTDAMLTSSSVPETDYTAWNSGTAYTVGQKCMVTTPNIHKNYECLINNTNKYPPTYSAGTLPEWLDLGATNRWRMFDGKVGNLTSKATSIIVELTPGKVFNSVALFGLSGTQLALTFTDPTAGVVYSATVALTESPDVIDWYTYFFTDFTTVTEAVKTDLPAYGSAVLKIEITAGTGNATCGHCVLGTLNDFGWTQFGSSVGIVDYSVKDVDAFGNATIVQRKYAQTVEYDVRLYSSQVREMQRKLADLRTTPVVWVGAVNFASTIVYGWYKDFSINIAGPAISTASVSVEEFR